VTTHMRVAPEVLAEIDKRRGAKARPEYLQELLLAETSMVEVGSEIKEFPLDQIEANPYQIREVDFENVAELANDIYANGMLQIPIGRLLPDGKPQQAFGHRRKLAHELIVAHGQDGDEDFPDWEKFTKMRLIIKPLTDLEMYSYMAAENSQRENPNAIKIAESIKLGKEAFNISAKEAGGKHGVRSEGQISDLLSLLTLPDEVKELISMGAFGNTRGAGQGHGKQLVRLVNAGIDKDIILKVAADAANMELTVNLLKVRVDHEINLQKQHTTMLLRHCPNCNEAQLVSAFSLDNQGKQYWQCVACSDKSYRLNMWMSPENQAEKERLMAAKAAQEANSGGSGGGNNGSSGGSTSNRVVPTSTVQGQVATTNCPHCGKPMEGECKNCGQTTFIKPELVATSVEVPPMAEFTPAEPVGEVPPMEAFPTSLVEVSAEPEPETPPAPPANETVMVQIEEIQKNGRKAKMFIKTQHDNPAVMELAQRILDCLGDDHVVNMAAISHLLLDIDERESREYKIREAIGDDLPLVMKERIVKKILKVL